MTIKTALTKISDLMSQLLSHFLALIPSYNRTLDVKNSQENILKQANIDHFLYVSALPKAASEGNNAIMSNQGQEDSPLSKVIEEFLSYLSVTRNHPNNTVRNARSILRKLQNFLKEYNIPDPFLIDRSLLLKFLEEQFNSPSYRYSAISHLRQFFDFINHPDNPARSIKLPKINPSEAVKFLSKDELTCLMSVMEEHVKKCRYLREYALVLLMLHTGIRPNEAISLKKEDIEKTTGVIVIRKTKTQKSRVVQAPVKALEAIEFFHKAFPNPDNPYVFYPYAKGLESQKPISYRVIAQAVKTLMKASGIYKKGLSLHCLRHTFSRALLAARFSREEIQKLLGHSSIRTTEIYTVVLEQDILKKSNQIHNAITSYMGKELK